MRATIIDDDADIVDLLTELLEALGFDCLAYSSALPGIDELIASRPDLIMVDIELHPRREQLTGLQVIHSARSSPELRDTPVVIAYTDRSRLEEAWPDLMSRGDIHRLEKPFDLGTFERVVQMAVGGSPHDGPHLARIDLSEADEG